MIILEGPDGGGKTTLIQQLANVTKLRISPKAVSSEGKGLKNIASHVEMTLGAGWQTKLFDRFALISGPIYGAMTSMAPPNDPFLDKMWHFRMEKLFLGLRPLIIYCLPPLPDIRANLLRDQTSAQIVGGNLDAIYYAYQARAARDFAQGIATIYDYTNTEHLSIMVGRIKLRLQEEGIY